MKYDDEFMVNKSSGGSGSGSGGQTVKPVVGIIKKSSMVAYRSPVLYSTSRVAENVVEARTITPAGNPDDLLVVAYSSNLYRDDFMALKLESRDMLIPWNGDQNLLIDRYDCRGYLYDLEPYDADLMSDERRNPKYSKEEIEMEHACDLERYMYLKDEEQNDESGPSKNGVDDDVNDDYDSNREIGPSSKRYANIGFSYDGSTTTTDTEANNKNDAEIEQVDKSTEKLFVPDEALQLPLGMLVPETVKMNQIVMKTASFVAKQGLQMEILLKTKQASNSQFDFLNFDNHLNPYYKHLIQLIRDNKIDPMVYLIEPPKQEDDAKKSTESQSDDDNDDDNDDDDNYLHPLLFKKIEPVVKVEQNNKQEDNKPVEEETNTTDKKMEETVEKADEKDDKPSEHDEDDEEKGKDKEMREKEEEEEKEKEKGEEPEGVAKTIIDKLAEYVGRNGREFEKNIAKKDDERFDFIKPGHKHHKYYCRMIEKAKKARRREEEEEERKKKKSDDDEKRKKTRSRSPSSSSSSSSSSDHSDREKKKKRKKEKDKDKEKEKDKDKEREKSSSHHKKSSSHHHKSKKKHRKKSKSKDRHR